MVVVVVVVDVDVAVVVVMLKCLLWMLKLLLSLNHAIIEKSLYRTNISCAHKMVKN